MEMANTIFITEDETGFLLSFEYRGSELIGVGATLPEAIEDLVCQLEDIGL